MRPRRLLLAALVTFVPSTLMVRDVVGSITSDAENATTVVLRFSSQQVTSCNEPKEQVARRKLNCRAEKRWATSTATLLFEPLVDSRRGILRGDRRSPFSVELRHKNSPVEQPLSVPKGPWRITWRESAKSVRAEVEDAPINIQLARTIGKCRSGNWRCWFDSRATENRLEVRTRVGS
jgi:hypothetical protein